MSLGQEKDQVIEVLGGPNYKDRKSGQDRWTYIIYENNIRHEKLVYFLDGVMTYKGLPMAPFISAEEQDRFNAEKNLELTLHEQKDKRSKAEN